MDGQKRWHIEVVPHLTIQEKPIQKSETWEELKEWQIKKLCAEIDFSIDKMVSCRHIPMETLRVEVEKLKVGNVANCFEK